MKQERAQLTPFGLAVRKRLLELNMTQVELAQLLGTNKQYLHKILCGNRSGKKYVARIARILDIELAA